MQRLIIRLTIVALMVSCGVYLIVQSQRRGDAIASEDSENLVLPPRAKAKAAEPIVEPGAAADTGVYDDIGPTEVGADPLGDPPASHFLFARPARLVRYRLHGSDECLRARFTCHARARGGA